MGGMFSTIHAVSVCVIAAALQGCAIVGRTAPWLSAYTTSPSLRGACAADGVEPGLPCYFEPLSRCALHDALVGAPPPTNLLRRNQQDHLRLNPLLSLAARRTNLTSDLLLVSSALAWLMRPRPQLAAAVRLFGDRAGLGRSAAQARAGSVESAAAAAAGPDAAGARIIAMHVRHGDKPANSARALGASAWRVGAESFELWGRRVASLLGAEAVLLMTDDAEVERELGSKQLFRVAPAPMRCAAGARRAGADPRAAQQGAKRLLKHMAATMGGSAAPHTHPPPGHEAMQEASSPSGDECGGALFRDDGVLILSGVMLLANCAATVGTLNSNVDRAVVELAAARRFPPLFFDPLNDVWSAFAAREVLWLGAVAGNRRVHRTMERLRADGDPWSGAGGHAGGHAGGAQAGAGLGSPLGAGRAAEDSEAETAAASAAPPTGGCNSHLSRSLHAAARRACRAADNSTARLSAMLRAAKLLSEPGADEACCAACAGVPNATKGRAEGCTALLRSFGMLRPPIRREAALLPPPLPPPPPPLRRRRLLDGARRRRRR